MDKIGRNIDEEKRGKLLVLAAFISIAIFVTKITQAQAQIVVWRVYLNAAIYFLIAFVGLIWAFGFQIKKKSILFLLLPSFYVFSQALFIEFFFFQKFSRIYEAIIPVSYTHLDVYKRQPFLTIYLNIRKSRYTD